MKRLEVGLKVAFAIWCFGAGLAFGLVIGQRRGEDLGVTEGQIQGWSKCLADMKRMGVLSE